MILSDNITSFIELTLEAMEKEVDGFTLFEMVKNNEKLLNQLCYAVCGTYDNLQPVKGFYGGYFSRIHETII